MDDEYRPLFNARANKYNHEYTPAHHTDRTVRCSMCSFRPVWAGGRDESGVEAPDGGAIPQPRYARVQKIQGKGGRKEGEGQQRKGQSSDPDPSTGEKGKTRQSEKSTAGESKS